METNTPNREAMLDVISKINAVDGFDPSAFVEEYEGLDGISARSLRGKIPF